MKLAMIGYGQVGSAVATAALAAGHQVTLVRSPHRPDGADHAREAQPRLSAARVADAPDALADADIVMLAVPFGAVEATIAPLADALAGRVLIDACNPVGPGLTHGLASARSGAEVVAELAPGASVVKAFSVYGYENFAERPSGPVRPMLPIAGDDPDANRRVADLIESLGWEPLIVGPLASALQLEHLTLLWVRLVRLGGEPSRLVWAALRGGAA